MKHKKCDLFFLFICTLLLSIDVVHFARLFRSFCTIFPFILHDFQAGSLTFYDDFFGRCTPYLRI